MSAPLGMDHAALMADYEASMMAAESACGQWYQWGCDAHAPRDPDEEPLGRMAWYDARTRQAMWAEPEGGAYPGWAEGFADAARLNWALVEQAGASTQARGLLTYAGPGADEFLEARFITHDRATLQRSRPAELYAVIRGVRKGVLQLSAEDMEELTRATQRIEEWYARQGALLHEMALHALLQVGAVAIDRQAVEPVRQRDQLIPVLQLTQQPLR
jgi:hypothetical protein